MVSVAGLHLRRPFSVLIYRVITLFQWVAPAAFLRLPVDASPATLDRFFCIACPLNWTYHRLTRGTAWVGGFVGTLPPLLASEGPKIWGGTQELRLTV